MLCVRACVRACVHRYQLLLESLLHHSEADDPALPALHEALALIKSIAMTGAVARRPPPTAIATASNQSPDLRHATTHHRHHHHRHHTTTHPPPRQ